MRSVVFGLVLVAVCPAVAHAWTPGTHILLGEAVLRSTAALPAGLAALLEEFPWDFLYGSIAADTSIAKKYARFGRHCHSWTVGFEILTRARDERLQAFAWGYLAHLAADVVAHNYFVPHQLAVTSSTTALGHSYWESRFETHLSPRYPKRAVEVIRLDHGASDTHLDRVLSPTIFSTPTNRRIFRGMVHATDSASWQRVFALVAAKSRWDLAEAVVAAHVARSYDYVMDLLIREAGSVPYTYDPSGDRALRTAKRVRRDALRAGGDEAAADEARRSFGLPDSTLPYAANARDPLYLPATRPESS
ncbi:MAG TPA: zinc dependent phospholipase C family protein [Gemmatimonadaceae bacterium]|nr:zinc dependent phospholipase C family protein [Gemmatimonadaceae bacterium]